jgi:hypothetical protein
MIFSMAVRRQNIWEDLMEHKSLDKVRDVADILPNWLTPRPMSKSERLTCWADALERDLTAKLGLKTEIRFDGKGGALTIHYLTLEQLDELVAKLNG